MTHARGMRLFYGAVGTVLGLIGIAVFIVCVIALAFGVTWSVVQLDAKIRRARKARAGTPAA